MLRTPANGERPIEARVRDLQSTAGNAAVGRFLQRESATGEAAEGAPAKPVASPSLLKYGVESDEVSDLQRRLNTLGAAKPPLAIDGIFGRLTQVAVRQYQQEHPPLTVDGDAGPETRAALDRTSNDPWEIGKAQYAAERYGTAYDEFTKAYEASSQPELLFDRAQALRYLDGRRSEAIALYEQFVTLDVPGDSKDRARKHLDELRGPGKSGDTKKDDKAANDLYEKGAEFYKAEQYARAYDEFSRAYEATGDPALLWNRAQALRFLGGRRAEAMALYEQLLTANIPDDTKAAARRDIADLRGPGRSGDRKKDDAAVDAVFKKGSEFYKAEQYAQAYDEFSKAFEITGDLALLWNRAQSLRFVGGRRSEAMTLFEQLLAGDLPEDQKKAARVYLEQLRGPGKRAGAAGKPAAR